MSSDYLQLENQILEVLKNIYDPEIPVNIYDLGLIYEIDVKDNNDVDIRMTLTAPNCPMADDIVNEVNQKIQGISGVNKVNLELTFKPRWDKSMMSEEAKLELGFL